MKGYRSFFYWKTLIVLLIAAILSTSIYSQDDDNCPSIVLDAITLADETCNEIERNSICYGNDEINVEGRDGTELDFDEPGDIAEIQQVISLTTSPLNVDEGTWGVALLSMQSNLLGGVPGQSVIFVLFGDVQLENATDVPETIEHPTLAATASGNINVRTGPGTNYAVAGGLTAGDEIILLGRNESSDWAQIIFNDGSAWVYVSLLTLDGDVQTLDVVESDASQVEAPPTHAFSLTTGIGKEQCKEAPHDGVLVQAPKDMTVNFLINGVEVTIGSTAYVRQLSDSDGTLVISNLDGSVVVRSGEKEVPLDVGYKVTATENNVDDEQQPLDFDDIQGLPTGLLPEPIELAPPGRQYNAGYFCMFRDGGPDVARTGETIVLRMGWRLVASTMAQDIRALSQAQITYDGVLLEPWGYTGPSSPSFNEETQETTYKVEWYWVVPNIQAGQHIIQMSGIEGWLTSIGLDPNELLVPCTLTAQ